MQALQRGHFIDFSHTAGGAAVLASAGDDGQVGLVSLSSKPGLPCRCSMCVGVNNLTLLTFLRAKDGAVWLANQISLKEIWRLAYCMVLPKFSRQTARG